MLVFVASCAASIASSNVHSTIRERHRLEKHRRPSSAVIVRRMGQYSEDRKCVILIAPHSKSMDRRTARTIAETSIPRTAKANPHHITRSSHRPEKGRPVVPRRNQYRKNRKCKSSSPQPSRMMLSENSQNALGDTSIVSKRPRMQENIAPHLKTTHRRRRNRSTHRSKPILIKHMLIDLQSDLQRQSKQARRRRFLAKERHRSQRLSTWFCGEIFEIVVQE